MLLVGMLAREMGSPSSLCPLLFRQVELQHVGILEVPAAGLARGRCQGQLAEVPTVHPLEGVSPAGSPLRLFPLACPALVAAALLCERSARKEGVARHLNGGRRKRVAE